MDLDLSPAQVLPMRKGGWDRGWGKVPDAVDVEDNADADELEAALRVVDSMSVEERKKMVKQ